MGIFFFFGFCGLVFAVFLAWRFRRFQQRRALLASPLSRDDRALLLDQVPLIARLPTDLHQTLEGKINLFLDQVDFHGCDGLEVSQEMRLSIAGQACLLVVNSDAWFDTLRTILIYPGAFQSVQRRQNGFVVTEAARTRIGESWAHGPVVLSWQASEFGAKHPFDGKNVVIHEFAHQIDALSGHTDAVPILAKGQTYSAWADTFRSAYEAHAAKVARGQPTVLDAYGATAHEEFFAVAVEAFFETPGALAQDEPAVYEQLSKLFQLDPADW